jgi:hypothetical protein
VRNKKENEYDILDTYFFMERKQYVKIPIEKEIEVILTEKIFGRIGEREERVSTTLPTNLLSR